MIELSKLRSVHFASNLGVIHLTIALLKVFNPLSDQIVFDVGHQSYIYKMLTDRYKQIKSIRTYKGLSGFQDPYESKYDKFSAGHAGTSLSVATGIYYGLTKKQQQTNDVIAIVGDASLANGLALEALEANVDLKAPMIIIVNDNNMSIGQDIGGLHHILINLQNKKNRDNFFTQLGYYYIGVVDGHDINNLVKALKRAKAYKHKYQKSVIIHIKTKKGYGYCLDTDGTYHSYQYNTNIQNSITKSIGYYLATQLANRKKDDYLLISPSMTFNTGFELLKTKKPDSFIDLGIQEENAVTIAAGIAIKNNYHPIINTYATFIQRCYDQLLHDVARLKLGISILLDRADLASSNGSSHAGIYDVAMLKSIPNTIITSGLTKEQNYTLLKLSIEQKLKVIFAIRYANKDASNDHKLIEYINKFPIYINEWQILKHNFLNKKCFISYGTYYLKILQNFFYLNNISFINALFINSYHKNNLIWLTKQKFEEIIIYERINETNNLASDIEQFFYENNIKIKITKLAYHGFVEHGENEQLDKIFGMDLDSLKQLLN